MKILFPICKNPLVQDNLRNRFNEWLCGTHKNKGHYFHGCIKQGELTGLPQVFCKRCGHSNEYPHNHGVAEWQLPDRLNKKIMQQSLTF